MSSKIFLFKSTLFSLKVLSLEDFGQSLVEIKFFPPIFSKSSSEICGQKGFSNFKESSKVFLLTSFSSDMDSNKFLSLIAAVLYSNNSKSFLTNLKLPLIPFSSQSIFLSGEAKFDKNHLAVSIPYLSETTSGKTPLPFDLLIFWPSSP